MRRFIANYTIVPHRGILVNHVTTLDDDSRLAGVEPVRDELAYTLYIPGTICILPQKCKHLLNDTRLHSLSREQLYQQLSQLITPHEIAGLVAVAQWHIQASSLVLLT